MPPSQRRTATSPKPRAGKNTADFPAVFAALRAILEPYAPRLAVVHDTDSNYHLDTYTIGPGGRPVMFAGVRIMKNYVSYYFMPVYAGMPDGMSPALKKRMQGKACFNFTDVDPALLAELKALTKQGWNQWKKIEWV